MNLTTLAQQHPRWMDHAIRIDRVPGAAWLALQAAALTSTWLWMARRMLHPAADGYRALGWRIEQARLERDGQDRLWRCFVTRRAGAGAMHACERIVNTKGIAFTDTSAWYGAAAAGSSQGPWQAVTVARPL